jgi:hypothetical protein
MKSRHGLLNYRSGVFWAILLASLLLSPQTMESQALHPASGRDYSLDEARKVLRAIDKVVSETQTPWDGRFREVAISESELNSYIAYRIETEKEEIMKQLKLKLFKENRIEGMIRADLRGQKIPQFIEPELIIYFAADVKVSGGAVKIDIIKLFVGEQPLQPYVIDLIMAISARLSGQEATSISDWYELPFGIKDIKTHKGKAIFFY